MSSRTAPYRTPSPERVIAEGWRRDNGDGVPLELSGPIEGWDYATDLLLSRRVTLDVHGVLDEAGLPANAALRLCVRSRPSGSNIKTLSASVIVDADASMVDITARINGADLAGSLVLETVLELASEVVTAPPFVATRSSSILWRDQVDFALDGDSGLLPVAPISFAASGLPAGAAWYVSLDTARWDWAAMGSLLVLLNTDNPAVVKALDDPNSNESAVLLDGLESDLVTDLVGRALDDETFVEQYGREDDEQDDYSLGALVRALVRSRLCRAAETVDEALQRLAAQRRSDPSMYRALVQDALGYPRSTRP